MKIDVIPPVSLAVNLGPVRLKRAAHADQEAVMQSPQITARTLVENIRSDAVISAVIKKHRMMDSAQEWPLFLRRRHLPNLNTSHINHLAE